MAYPDSKRLTEWINQNSDTLDGVSFQTNAIFCGDCQDVLNRFPEECADLIYADPPFFSNQPYEILWGDGYEKRAFNDRWAGGIQNYLAWMEPKLRQCHKVLKSNGSMYLHCDWHAGAYLRVLMDKIFGDNRLVNEIIWKRTSAHTGEGIIKRLGTVHDTLLLYSKSDTYSFNPTYTEFDKDYEEKFYKNVDPDGRVWTSSDLTGAGTRQGETGKPWRGIDPNKAGRHWVTSPEKLEEWAKEGSRVWQP